MKNAVISSTGSYLPETIIHNEELTQFPQASKMIISQKTGVFARRSAAEDECTSDLAVKSARNCLEKIGFPAEKIEGIIVSTSSPDRIQPATATRVQHMLGAGNAFAFDINSVCSGSTFGISLADALIKTGQYNNILFIASEVYSRILNKKDFSTYPFFGDGSGAIFFQAGNSSGVLHSCLRTDGSGAETICVPGGGSMMPYEKIKHPKFAFFKMNGKKVFNFAVSKGTEIILQLIEEAGVSLKDIRCFVCHQANVNIILKIAEKIDVSPDNFYMNLFRYGNTASASVPIALDEAISKGVISKGDLAVTAAFGGGLSWGANLIEI
ncbi:beta-ketoacyl-ACP synthase III [Desulfococcaceae bacterium HSG8]|nr:beta-ketoacyl-ACP synthase III [Desulfococcaceae bacterium HSG8]